MTPQIPSPPLVTHFSGVNSSWQGPDKRRPTNYMDVYLNHINKLLKYVLALSLVKAFNTTTWKAR